MHSATVMEIPGLALPHVHDLGHDSDEIVRALLDLADSGLRSLRLSGRTAALGRLRGTGRGVHFHDLVRSLEEQRPLELHSPFEGSELVSGAIWAESVTPGHPWRSLAKLRWEAGADDLPMHVHEHSDRFIIVHEGRGYFHVSDQGVRDFDGSDVRSIPARERDVFMFLRGVVHTFSTAQSPMTLLSCQLPFLPFDDPRQYRLPEFRWTAKQFGHDADPRVACDPAWTVLAGGSRTAH